MKTIRTLLLPALAVLALLTGLQPAEPPTVAGSQPNRDDGSAARPNIIFIYADDLGYGDLGCYGAKDSTGAPVATPNLDALAAGGIRFTDFYAASPVCSPSRAALLTGRYPIRQGINNVFFPESYTGIDSAEVTLAETLRQAGYHTGIVGKWHLGHLPEFRPTRHGFDSYFGIPYSNDMMSVVYLRDDTVEDFTVDQSRITQRYTAEALDFIDTHRQKSPQKLNAARPFFLYLAHSMPHVPIYASPAFVGKSRRGLYGDVLLELDWSVGEIVRKVRVAGLEANTLIVFSSDNGPWLVKGEDAGSAGPLREGKQTTFEGGMRVPAIAYWKGKIPAGRVETGLATMMDWFPTLTWLGGGKLPASRPLDGEDIGSVLAGTGKRRGEQLAYYRGGKLEAFRLGDWKLKLPYAGSQANGNLLAIATHPLLLTNLRDDIGEQHNLADQNPGKVAEIQAAMAAFQQSLGKLPPAKVVFTGPDQSLSKDRKPPK